jgi:hypothetical protein
MLTRPQLQIAQKQVRIVKQNICETRKQIELCRQLNMKRKE